MRKRFEERMRKRGKKARAQRLYTWNAKNPLEPAIVRIGVRGELQHFRSDHYRVWRWSVQMPITEIVDVLCAKGFMPARLRVSRHKATILDYLLLLDMTWNHFHRKVFPTKRAAIIKPSHRHHIPNIFSIDGARRKNGPFQKGDTLLVKADRVKDLKMYTMDPRVQPRVRACHAGINKD